MLCSLKYETQYRVSCKSAELDVLKSYREEYSHRVKRVVNIFWWIVVCLGKSYFVPRGNFCFWLDCLAVVCLDLLYLDALFYLGEASE